MNEELKAIVAELKRMESTSEGRAILELRAKKAMEDFSKWSRKQRMRDEEQKRRELAHWLKIKDIPFMANS